MTCLQSRHNETREKRIAANGRQSAAEKDDTFNQILNSNLASMDPGFGQFALAKASSDLFKKVINK